MRHRVDHRKLGRRGEHLRAMLANMAISLIEKESIRTTLPRARELRRYIEPLVTLARKQTLDAKRRLSAKLHQQKKPVHKMLDEISKRFEGRPGGYVRVLKAGERSGDNTSMAVIQFVDYPDILAKKMEESAAAEGASKNEKPTADAPKQETDSK